MNPEVLQAEIEKRQLLQVAIDTAIDRLVFYKEGCHARSRKGQVQSLIAQTLGIRLNSNFRGIINKRMQARGFREQWVLGLRYYRNALLKEGYSWEEKTL
jgi:hypothetical protein